jgi:putative AbiEi antitoxin of type IV toxin-antitoxin system
MSYYVAVPTKSTVGRLSEFAADQWGLVTRRQVEAAGVSPATMTRLIAEGAVLERIARGVYHLVGSPMPDQVELRAAWLQLAPEVPAWRRAPEQGVISHRSAAALYGLGHLPADVHEFIVPSRQRSRRPDVRLHIAQLAPVEWINIGGLLVTRPARIAADLLAQREEPAAVAQVIADAIRPVYDYPGRFAEELAPYAARLGFRRGNGLALLRWLLDLTGDPEASIWLEEAHQSLYQRQQPAEISAPAPSTRTGMPR